MSAEEDVARIAALEEEIAKMKAAASANAEKAFNKQLEFMSRLKAKDEEIKAYKDEAGAVRGELQDALQRAHDAEVGLGNEMTKRSELESALRRLQGDDAVAVPGGSNDTNGNNATPAATTTTTAAVGSGGDESDSAAIVDELRLELDAAGDTIAKLQEELTAAQTADETHRRELSECRAALARAQKAAADAEAKVAKHVVAYEREFQTNAALRKKLEDYDDPPETNRELHDELDKTKRRVAELEVEVAKGVVWKDAVTNLKTQMADMEEEYVAVVRSYEEAWRENSRQSSALANALEMVEAEYEEAAADQAYLVAECTAQVEELSAALSVARAEAEGQSGATTTTSGQLVDVGSSDGGSGSNPPRMIGLISDRFASPGDADSSTIHVDGRGEWSMESGENGDSTGTSEDSGTSGRSDGVSSGPSGDNDEDTQRLVASVGAVLDKALRNSSGPAAAEVSNLAASATAELAAGSKLVDSLTAMMRELEEENESLEARVAELESEVATLRSSSQLGSLGVSGQSLGSSTLSANESAVQSSVAYSPIPLESQGKAGDSLGARSSSDTVGAHNGVSVAVPALTLAELTVDSPPSRGNSSGGGSGGSGGGKSANPEEVKQFTAEVDNFMSIIDDSFNELDEVTRERDDALERVYELEAEVEELRGQLAFVESARARAEASHDNARAEANALRESGGAGANSVIRMVTASDMSSFLGIPGSPSSSQTKHGAADLAELEVDSERRRRVAAESALADAQESHARQVSKLNAELAVLRAKSASPTKASPAKANNASPVKGDRVAALRRRIAELEAEVDSLQRAASGGSGGGGSGGGDTRPETLIQLNNKLQDAQRDAASYRELLTEERKVRLDLQTAAEAARADAAALRTALAEALDTARDKEAHYSRQNELANTLLREVGTLSAVICDRAGIVGRSERLAF